MQNKEVSAKSIKTKILKGGFDSSNSSKEATEFIRDYIHIKNYDISQCAYSDKEIGLHEWGIYKDGRWVLFDLVVFERDNRGDKNKIIEILEYNGPFHYRLDEVQIRGDEKAYPWKSNNITVSESYNKDLSKEKIARDLTNNYTIIWAEKWHKK